MKYLGLKAIMVSILLSQGVAYGALENVAKMQQISRGLWQVTCHSGRIQRATTSDILDDRVCGGGGGSTDKSDCFKAVVKGVPTYQHDDVDEVQKVLRACSSRGRGTGGCILQYKSWMSSMHYNRLEESIELAKFCSGAPFDTAKCMKVSSKALAAFERNDKEEIKMLSDACISAGEGAANCFEVSTRNLPTYEYNDMSEVVAILRGCRY